jgi:hypothetical protein
MIAPTNNWRKRERRIEHCFYAEIATDITTPERKDTYILCEFQWKRNALILNKILQQTL